MRDAIRAAAKLRECEPRSAGNSYNAGCVYARALTAYRQGKPELTDDDANCRKLTDLALACLRESIDSGWTDFDHMRQDADLASLFGRPEFEALFPVKTPE